MGSCGPFRFGTIQVIPFLRLAMQQGGSSGYSVCIGHTAGVTI